MSKSKGFSYYFGIEDEAFNALLEFIDCETELFRNGELAEATKAHMKRFEEEWREDHEDCATCAGMPCSAMREAMHEERERFQQYAMAFFNDYRLPALCKEREADMRREESR